MALIHLGYHLRPRSGAVFLLRRRLAVHLFPAQARTGDRAGIRGFRCRGSGPGCDGESAHQMGWYALGIPHAGSGIHGHQRVVWISSQSQGANTGIDADAANKGKAESHRRVVVQRHSIHTVLFGWGHCLVPAIRVSVSVSPSLCIIWRLWSLTHNLPDHLSFSPYSAPRLD